MACEIEFLPVGEGSKAGDAIVVRYGTPTDFQLMLIDGGFEDTGAKIVDHLRSQFGATASLAHIVLTHADVDHASGLREVIRQIPVANIWMHIPWLLAPEVRHLFKNKNFTDSGLTAAIKKEYDILADIIDLGLVHKCNFYYPFTGSIIGPFRVLSPTRFAYTRLLPQFDRTPDPDQEAIEGEGMWLGKQPSALNRLFEKAVAQAQKWVKETWENERLKDGGITSASNESSVVLYGELGEQGRALLTGDAGVNALIWAANQAERDSLPLAQFKFVQVPHHGSRRNVGPTILNRLLGPIQLQNSPVRFSAYVSAPPDDDTHPRKMVLNAFLRRGGKLVMTQGEHIVWRGGFPLRNGYGPVRDIPFSPDVEEYD